MEMQLEATSSAPDVLEMRPLTDAELDEVNGGFFFIAGLLVLAFEAGVIAGAIAANYSMTGNAMGNIHYRH
jgi:hypothetical protein